jgi:hypothetical protein
MPFIFGALKVNATLALIGAIVAEFFGSPTVGLGFRISTEAARMNMSWSGARSWWLRSPGSLAYALLVQLERRAAFWHPSSGSMMVRSNEPPVEFPLQGTPPVQANHGGPSGPIFFTIPTQGVFHESFFS